MKHGSERGINGAVTQELAGDAHAVLTVDFRKLDSADRDRVWNALFGFLNERLNRWPGSIPAQPEPA
jgi:hypothetical protein